MAQRKVIAKKESERFEERMLNIMAQLRAYENGYQSSITCPFCTGINREGDQFCCKTFAMASLAALERVRVEDSIKIVQAVAERHQNN
jgi:hypothetical protein